MHIYAERKETVRGDRKDSLNVLLEIWISKTEKKGSACGLVH